jgi:hypothetical protein
MISGAEQYDDPSSPFCEIPEANFPTLTMGGIRSETTMGTPYFCYFSASPSSSIAKQTDVHLRHN